MKKSKLWTWALMILPLGAVGLGRMPDAVAIYYPEAGEGAMSCLPVYCSYFAYVTDAPASICLPGAVLVGCIAFALAVAYAISQKPFFLKGILAMAFLSMLLAVLPILVRSDIFVLPNVGFPILMGVECLLAGYFIKKPKKEAGDKPVGPRLGQ